jgi:ferrous iron transport protein B
LVAVNLLVLAVTGILVNRLAFRGARVAFIMEMPLYHLPSARTIGLFVWNSTLAFLRKAGTLIVVVSAIVWTLSVLPGGEVEHSLLAGLGHALAPLGKLMGLYDWRLIVSLMTSFVAKENTIATLGILFGSNGGESGLPGRVAAVLSPAAALAFLVVLMLFIPCVATMAAIKQEAGWRWTMFSIALLLAISLGAGILVYNLFAWL